MKCTPGWPYIRLHPGVSQHSRGGCENWRMPSDPAGGRPTLRRPARHFAQTCRRFGAVCLSVQRALGKHLAAGAGSPHRPGAGGAAGLGPGARPGGGLVPGLQRGAARPRAGGGEGESDGEVAADGGAERARGLDAEWPLIRCPTSLLWARWLTARPHPPCTCTPSQWPPSQWSWRTREPHGARPRTSPRQRPHARPRQRQTWSRRSPRVRTTE